MLKSQELQLKMSEVRQELNKAAGKPESEVTDELRGKVEAWRKDLDRMEGEYRAAVTAEDTETRHRGEHDDGEAAEFRALIPKVRLGRYLAAAAGGVALGEETPEGELRAAVKLKDPNLIPWAAFDPGEKRERKDGSEHRADTATAAPSSIEAMQEDILARVFAPTCAMFCGVEMRAVERGDEVYPVLTQGQDAATLDKGAAHEAGAATIASTTLDRRRATARYIFRLEDSAGMGETLERALRQDMIAAIGEAIDKGVLSGDGTRPNPAGFFDATSGPLTIPADPSDAGTFGFSDIVSAASAAVDGRYAVNLAAVRTLLQPSLYAVAASAFASAGEISGADYLMRNSGGIRASDNMPAVGNSSGDAIYIGLNYRSGAMGGNAVLPMWQGVQIFRDEATRIASGEIALTAISLYNFAVLRPAAYRAFKVRLGG